MSYVTGSPTSTPKRSDFMRIARRARLFMLAVAPAAAMIAAPALGSSIGGGPLTWDPNQVGTGSDGSGTWDLTSSLWSNGASDTVWLNDGTTSAIFGVGGSAGTVNINAGILAAGLTFNAASGAYTIAANGANTLTLTVPTVTVASGQFTTISAPIAGTAGQALNGASGNLTLTGANTYTGTTAVNAGTLTVGPGGSLGSAGNALTFGMANTTSIGALALNANVTVSSLTSSTASGANALTIGDGSTLTVTGGLSLGFAPIDTTAPVTTLSVTGAGSLSVIPTNNANFTIGSSGYNNTVGTSTGNISMATLTNFTYNTGATGTGNFQVGFGYKSLGKVALAINSTIIANTFDVGDSQGSSLSDGNNGGTSTVTFGTGVTVIDASNIRLGFGKSPATVSFQNATSGTLTIAGQAGGATTANITIGTASGGSGAGTSTLNLAGHTVAVQANNVIIGNLAGASNGVGNGTLTFDNGTFSASSLQLAVASSGTPTSGGPIGILTIGGTTLNAATGVFNVNGPFYLANNSLSAQGVSSKGTLTINGGTVNIGSNILVIGSATTTLTLAGGTLNMEGFQINGAAAAGQSNTVNLPAGGQSATLENLGGTGINGQGLTTGGGALTLEGSNTYTGGTNINGTLIVGTGGTTGTLGTGAVANFGDLIFNRSATYLTSDIIAGSGNITQTGTGAIVLAGSITGNQALTISNGALVATGTFGAITMASGALDAGTTAADGSIGTINAASLTTTGGDLRFDVGGSSSDQILVNGPASFTDTTLSVAPDGPLTVGTQTLIASTSLTGLPTLTTTSIGRSTLALGISGNNVTLSVTGGAATLTWNGINGSTWNANDSGGGVANFLNGATQDTFYSGDLVTFDDSNTGSYAVAISGSVQPTSVTFNNSAHDYTVSGGSIAGATGLTKSGTGNLTLANVNTFTGATNVTGGNLTIASGGSIASDVISVAAGAGLTVAAGGDITVAPALTDNGTVTFNNPARTLASLNGSGSVNLNGTALTLASDGTFSGGIQGTGSLIVAGGTIVLSGASSYAGGTTIDGGALQLGAGGATGSVTGPIAISATGTLTLNLSGTNVGNAISGAGGVTQIGAGTQILSGALSYSGVTTISSGAVEITGANTDSIGATAGSGNLIVGDGTTATALSITGTGSTSGSVTVNAGSTLAVAASGSVLGNSGVTLNGGTLIAGNATAANNLGTNPLTITPAGGMLQFTAASTNNGFNNPIAIGGTLTVNFNDSGATGRTFTYAGNGTVSGGGIIGAGNLAIINSGTLGLDTFALSNANPNFSGNIQVGNATGAPVRLEVTDALADTNILGTGAVTVANGSQVWFSQAAAAPFANTFNIAGIGTATDTPTLGALRLQSGNVLTGTINLTGNAAISIGTVTSSNATLNGAITGAYALTLENGIFTLANTSGAATSYGSGLAGSAATVVGPLATAVIGAPGSLSTGGLQLAGGGLNLNAQNIAVNNLSSTAAGQAVSLTASTGQDNWVIASTLVNVNPGDSISGAGVPGNTIVQSTATQETVAIIPTLNTPTATVTVAGLTGLQVGDPISGLGIPLGTTITAIDPVGLVLTLSNNVTAVMSNGTATSATVATGNVIVLNSNLSTSVTSEPLTVLDGSVISNSGPAATSGTATLTIGADNSNQSYSGLIVDGTSGGTLALVKNGTGSQTLTGPNTYTAGTTINGGALYVNNTAGSGAGSGTVTLNSGTLGGTGSIAGPVVAGSGAHTINPGAAGAGSIGALTVASLTTNTHTTLAFDLSSPGGTSDLLNVTGTLTLADATLQITSQASTGAASLGYYKVIEYGSLTGGTAGIVLPAIANNIVYTLDTTRDLGFIDVHRGYLGDLNDDGTVNATDLNTVLHDLGMKTTSWALGNFDGAATIDLNDLNDVLNNLGTSIASTAASGLPSGSGTPTPEPATLSVAGIAALALLIRRRRA